MKKTTATIKALSIINNHGPVTPKQFARLYFGENHEGWQRACKCGFGTTRGGGLVLWSGGYLGKLRKRGLVTYSPPSTKMRITDLGKKLLLESE